MFFHELRQDASIVGSEPLSEQIHDILQALAPAGEENKTLQTVLDFWTATPSLILNTSSRSEQMLTIKTAVRVPI